MTVKIDKSFEKDLDNVVDKKIHLKVAALIELMIEANDLSSIPNIKKLAGFKFHYRVRVGDYRAGFILKNQEIVFERFLHRKDIYKFYP